MHLGQLGYFNDFLWQVDNKMKFSILIPMYNVERYVGACLDSVLNQTFQDYEVIIYNDAGTDGSLNICEKFQRKYPDRVRIVSGKTNIGLCLGRIELVKYAKGEYCVFVDSDDLVTPYLLENIHDATREDAPDIVMYDMFAHYEFKFMFSYNRVFHFGHESRLFANEGLEEYYNSLATFQIHAIWRKAFKREAWNRIEFDDVSRQIQMGEDLYFTLKLMEHIQIIKYIPRALYYYRCNFGSMTHVFKRNALSEKLKVSEYFLKNIQNRRLDTNKLEKQIYQHVASDTIGYIEAMASRSCRLGITDREEIYLNIAKEPLIQRLINEKNDLLDDQQKDVIGGICANNFSKAEELIGKNRIHFFIRDILGGLILK